jgi:SET domain-containing protein
MPVPAIHIEETSGKGRGVFANEAIPDGTVVETAPVIVMSADDRKLLDHTLLHDYIFEWQPEGQHLCCMALGWVPIFNHSYTSNCEYFMDYDTQSMYIETVRNIEAGEELTINYNGVWDDDKKVWFDVK